MMRSSIRIALIMLVLLPASAHAQRQMENLTRGIVAVKQSGGGVYVGWRLFGTDPETLAFNVYRLVGGDPVALTANLRCSLTDPLRFGSEEGWSVSTWASPRLRVRRGAR